AVDHVLDAARGKSALALGPGLGQEPETAEAIRRLVRQAAELGVPLVVDADGLNAFAGRARELGECLEGRPAMLTPHPGELARLLGTTAAEVQADRLEAARRAAAETRAVVVLKGRLTLVAAPSGEVHANPTGNAGMASGGSGDVLTGILAALLGQGLDPLTAARLGVYLHGLAGDLAVEASGLAAYPILAAGDLVESLPAAFARLAAAGP
ncbi:MAG TPA: NAD(P)H-hydrate dehydratase, partial [Thermoanaerobaculia bacterium]|nr:NAD(P)H-hydrate dehydratase [Thermoanaerobaculia bacterium]